MTSTGHLTIAMLAMHKIECHEACARFAEQAGDRCAFVAHFKKTPTDWETRYPWITEAHDTVETAWGSTGLVRAEAFLYERAASRPCRGVLFVSGCSAPLVGFDVTIQRIREYSKGNRACCACSRCTIQKTPRSSSSSTCPWKWQRRLRGRFEIRQHQSCEESQICTTTPCVAKITS